MAKNHSRVRRWLKSGEHALYAMAFGLIFSTPASPERDPKNHQVKRRNVDFYLACGQILSTVCFGKLFVQSGSIRHFPWVPYCKLRVLLGHFHG